MSSSYFILLILLVFMLNILSIILVYMYCFIIVIYFSILFTKALFDKMKKLSAKFHKY